MVKAERIFYITGVVIIIICLLGGSLFKSIFNGMSGFLLEKGGLKYEYVNTYDDKIDEIFFKIKQAQLQIDKIRNFFSRDVVDESKYKKEENKIIENSVYKPLIDFISLILRIVFIIFAVILILSGLIMGLLNRSNNLKRRIEILEQKVSLIE